MKIFQYQLVNCRYQSIQNALMKSSSVRITQSPKHPIILLEDGSYVSNVVKDLLRIMTPSDEMKWVCDDCNAIMDKSNFTEYIKESDNDKNSVGEARIEYHNWRLLQD